MLEPSSATPAPLPSGFPASWLTPKAVALGSAISGRGVACRSPIARGELVVVWGGLVVSWRDYFTRLPEEERHLCLQIEDDLLLWTPTALASGGDFLNHGCAPNCGISGQVVVVAMRDVTVGEELTIDYAMTVGGPPPELGEYGFACQCGVASCRGRVTSEDWSDPALAARYAGYFSGYLQRRRGP